MLTVRREEARDIEYIYNINFRAFGREEEGKLVDRLRGRVYPFISLVAEEEGRPVGHILFTAVIVGDSILSATGLGPMAVLPEYQGEGVGSALINEGLRVCREERIEAVFVLGHAGYYIKFGFEHASRRGIYWKSSEFAPYFFVLELVPGALDGVQGEVVFHPAFEDV